MKASKRIKKIIAAVVAFALIIAIGFFANGLVGNPLSRSLAYDAGTKYIKLNYPDSGFYIKSAEYDFKMGCYTIEIINTSTIDSDFPLYCGFYGNITYDGYEDYVTNGRNTYDRMNKLYKELVDSVFNRSRFFAYAFESNYYLFGDLSKPDDSVSLEPGKEYDINELGREYGHLAVSLDYDNADEVESAEDLLLEIKELFDKNELPFYSIDLSLSHDKNFTVSLMNFLYSDIYKEGLKERIEKNNAADEMIYGVKESEISEYEAAVSQQ